MMMYNCVCMCKSASVEWIVNRCKCLDIANRRITRQMLKSISGEFDISSIHTLYLSDQGKLFP